MTYTVYFEIFGKKMKHDVEAASEADAKRKVAERMIFHKVVEHSPVEDIFADMFNGMVGVDIFKRTKK